ncbi:MAG: hypothetical protein AAGG47_19375, partial [Pseudomonadota bacterium]
LRHDGKVTAMTPKPSSSSAPRRPEERADPDALLEGLVAAFARCLAEADFRARLVNEDGTAGTQSAQSSSRLE